MEDISGSGLTSTIQKGTFVKSVLANLSQQDSKTRPTTSVNLYAKQQGIKPEEKRKK